MLNGSRGVNRYGGLTPGGRVLQVDFNEVVFSSASGCSEFDAGLEGGGACEVYLGDVEGFSVYCDCGSVRGAPFESIDVDEEGCFSAEVAEGGAEEGYGIGVLCVGGVKEAGEASEDEDGGVELDQMRRSEL